MFLVWHGSFLGLDLALDAYGVRFVKKRRNFLWAEPIRLGAYGCLGFGMARPTHRSAGTD